MFVVKKIGDPQVTKKFVEVALWLIEVSFVSEWVEGQWWWEGDSEGWEGDSEGWEGDSEGWEGDSEEWEGDCEGGRMMVRDGGDSEGWVG